MAVRGLAGRVRPGVSSRQDGRQRRAAEPPLRVAATRTAADLEIAWPCSGPTVRRVGEGAAAGIARPTRTACCKLNRDGEGRSAWGLASDAALQGTTERRSRWGPNDIQNRVSARAHSNAVALVYN